MWRGVCITLRRKEHRQNLANNPNCYTQDKKRAISKWCEHCWEYVRENTKFDIVKYKKRHAMPTIKEMGELVWEAQSGVPLFHFVASDGLPMSWNIPRQGKLDYIRYETGHIEPQACGGMSNPENLTFQSGRGNQHIQSSLPLNLVLSAYFSDNDEVLNRVDNVMKLHKSDRWNELREKLGL